VLAGCSPGARALSRNEINEPVFHETDFASLGASAGPVADRTREPGGYRSDFYFMPRFQYDFKVGPWASFTLLPVFWNFLLGGSQYPGNLSDLGIGKPLIALHGGVSGFSYSQRDGFDFPGAAALSGKYLFDASWFADMEGAAELRDVRSTANSTYGLSLGLGNQFTAKNSVKLEYAIRYFRFEPGLRYSDHDLWFGNGNAQTKLLLRHSYYPSPRHVLGPEFVFSFKDSDFRKEHYLALGFHYDYRF
jgi:hypothetical protein